MKIQYVLAYDLHPKIYVEVGIINVQHLYKYKNLYIKLAYKCK